MALGPFTANIKTKTIEQVVTFKASPREVYNMLMEPNQNPLERG